MFRVSLASYDVDATRLQEDSIYDWFLHNEKQTCHEHDPPGFTKRLLDAANAYAAFIRGESPTGQKEAGVLNTRDLGGSAVRQHFILLLAGRHLSSGLFKRLANEVENLMFVYLITSTNAKDYERSIVESAAKLRHIRSESDFGIFRDCFFLAEKRKRSTQFENAILALGRGDIRAFRMRYILAKLTQHVDVEAYGATGGHGSLRHYIDGRNDIEHILPEAASQEARHEFGDTTEDPSLVQRLGNLMLLEKSINQLLGNKPYSQKREVYSQSQYLLVKCQALRPTFGVADQITRVVSTIPSFPSWNLTAMGSRQAYLAQLSREVWEIPS